MRGSSALRGRVRNLHIGEITPIIPEDMGKTGNVDIYVSLRYGGIYRRGDNMGESSITAVSSETTKTATTY